MYPMLFFKYNTLFVIPAKAGTQARRYKVAWCAPERHEGTGWEEPNPGDSVPASLGPGSPLRSGRDDEKRSDEMCTTRSACAGTTSKVLNVLRL
jgi:hypothetical protein